MNHFGKFCLCDVLNLTDTLYIPANLFLFIMIVFLISLLLKNHIVVLIGKHVYSLIYKA